MHSRDADMSHALPPSEIDHLGEFVLERLMAPGGSARHAVRDLVVHMACHHPGAQALSPVLVLAIVANGLDETLMDPAVPPGTMACDLWRMATLLAADVIALGDDNPPRVTALLRHWNESDGFFLN